MKKQIAVLFLALGLAVGPAAAGVNDFAPFFDVDLEKDDIPTKAELEKYFVKFDDYNKKYNSFYDLLHGFDPDFYTTIAAYGMQEKRLKDDSEDLLLEFLSMIPKKYYQYIGPMMFEVPNMSEKILNLPGIKETKNQFPTRIAEQVKDIKNLEFVSPAYYFLLMPEAWPGYEEEIERPKTVRYYPKVEYDPKFYAAIKKLVRPEKYMPGHKEEQKASKTDLRTLRPTKDSLLTSADIKAFIATIDAVDDWAKQPENEFWLTRIGLMWMMYEKEDGLGRYVPAGLKDLINPCARLVQKTRILGRERELARLVAGEGFTLNEWAYTCDKTIKAYRLTNIRSGVVRSIREYQRGIYDDEIKGMSAYTQNVRFAAMQSIIQAHRAPLSDVMAFRENRQEFGRKLKEHGYRLFGYPITRY